LAGVTDRALVLAAASALKPLASVGTSPHITFALEAKDESRQFEGIDHAKTLLAAASTSHPNHFLKWLGPQSLFHLWPWMAMLSGLGKALPSGGHVTSAAFSLRLFSGRLMGLRPHYSGRSGPGLHAWPDSCRRATRR
ncbi:MAG: DUF115 domain-containing protein, partial [Deltaproteobacteria bacterium]|nr:DUF115 domain-containing protein [Deltaproteobacteria bacterium]